MSGEASDIMAPDEGVSIKGGTDKVTVCEMTWKASKTFLKNLAQYVPEFLTFNGSGKAEVNNAKLVGVLMSNLAEELVMAATGKPRDWVESLSFTDMAAVLGKAVELNLRPEMIAEVGNVVSRFRTLTAKATSQTRTIS